MKSLGKLFWAILVFGIILLLVEAVLFKDIKNSIGSIPALMIFILTMLSAVYVSLYFGWKDGQLEILAP